jgi:hypothetical protein
VQHNKKNTEWQEKETEAELWQIRYVDYNKTGILAECLRLDEEGQNKTY